MSKCITTHPNIGCVGWEIAKLLHIVVLSATKKAILAFSFLFIFVDEITTMIISPGFQSIVMWW
jgi:hypothetical protein